MEEFEPVQRTQRRGASRRRVVVDEDKERDLFIADECLGVVAITGSDRDDVGAHASDLVVALTQLRGMLAAVQSTKVSEEHQDYGLVAPEVAEPVWLAGGVDE